LESETPRRQRPSKERAFLRKLKRIGHGTGIAKEAMGVEWLYRYVKLLYYKLRLDKMLDVYNMRKSICPEVEFHDR
jgi:hypothetical protein